MTRNTDNLVKTIVDSILLQKYTVKFEYNKVIGGKHFTVITVGNEYKLYFNGLGGSLLRKYNSIEWVKEDISRHNFIFLLVFCRIYSKLFGDYTITVNSSNG